MKKLLIFLLLLCFVMPCFAGNLLQQEYETKQMQEYIDDGNIHNMSKKSLLENDYQAYLNGGGSIYGIMMYQKEKLGNAATSEKNLNLRYLNLAINKYDLIIKNHNPQIIQPDKITIDDMEYKYLSEEIKNIISTLNLFLLK